MTSSTTTANALFRQQWNLSELALMLRSALALAAVQIASVSQRFHPLALAVWIDRTALRASNAFKKSKTGTLKIIKRALTYDASPNAMETSLLPPPFAHILASAFRTVTLAPTA
jgi:hypothetical protein